MEADKIAFDADAGAYRIVDVDVAEPLEAVELDADEHGVAVVVRRQGRLLGFGAGAARGRVDREELGKLVARAAAGAIVRDLIAGELPGNGRIDAPSLTLAVCTHNRPDLLSRWFQAALAVRGSRSPGEGGAFDVLVVDNAPSDERTALLVAQQPGVRYVREPRPGLDFARNRALRESTSEFVAFVDDDAVVDVHWLDGFAETLHANPDAALVTGQVLPYELATRAQILFEARGGFRRGSRRSRYGGSDHVSNRFYPCGPGVFGAGCNMAVRRVTALELGGFDEALDTGAPLPGGGDLDMFYRVIRAGHPLVYEPRMLVFHEHRRDYEALRRQYWTWGQGYMAFVAKSHGSDPELRRRLRAITRWWFQRQLSELARSAIGSSPHPAGLLAAQLAGGVAGLAGTYPRSVRRTERIRREHA